MNTLPVGLVGVGLMGHGIALNIARRGYALTVLEHPGNQPLDELRALGVDTAESVQALVRRVKVLILCVTGSPEVEAVLLGEQGALAALRPGTVVIDCSTAIPVSTEAVARAVAQAGGRFLDAPMTRTPREAAEGRLNLLVGGDADLLQECLPLLQCFAEHITHTGAAGSGHRMKLLHNFVSVGQMTLLAEATACARKQGMDMQAFADVLGNGGGAGVALERLKSFILADDPSGIAFSVSNAAKDLQYYATMAHDAQAASQVADAASATLKAEVDAGHGDAMLPEVIGFLAKR